jgi:hypothetical protein
MNLLSKIGRASLMPVWALQLLTGSKSFVDNPVIGSAWLNQRGLHTARIRLAARMADWRRRSLAAVLSDEERRAYARDGFILKRDFLPPDLFAELREQVRDYRGTVREMIQGDTITRRVVLAPHVLDQMPAVRALLRDPQWRGLLHYVGSHGQEPLNYIQTILPHRFDAPPDPQLSLHADTFHATVKAWLFLTDVEEDEGPFVYVPGSHRMTPERLEWEKQISIGAAGTACRLTSRGSFRIDEGALAALNLPPPRRFAVPANTLVVADTSGFHARGPSRSAGSRVEIWAMGRSNPFVPWNGFDLWRFGGLGGVRLEGYWRVREWLDRTGLMANCWKTYPDRSPFDTE